MVPRLDLSHVATDDLLDLDNQLCFALYATSRRIVRAYRHELDKLELTYPQYLVMLVLWSWTKTREREPTVGALGARLDLDSGTLTPLLKRLEQKKLLVRDRSSRDERELEVRLTPAGKALKRRARCVPLSLLESSPLPLAELARMREQLNRLRAALAAIDAGATAVDA